MKIVRLHDGQLRYVYTTFGREMSFRFSLLSEVGKPYQPAARAMLEDLKAKGFTIKTLEVPAPPWYSDYAVLEVALPIRADVREITGHRPPTPGELRFGEGAVHYRTFPVELWRKPDGSAKRWIKADDDGLRYYR
jgi:hypothetical protein